MRVLLQTSRLWFLIVTILLLPVLSPGCRKQPTKESSVSTVPLGEILELVSKKVSRTDGDKTKFRLSFRCKKTADQNYRVLFHGYVKDENLIPPEKRNPYKFLNAAHEFKKRPDKCEPDELIEHEVTLMLKKGEYNFHFGLYDRKTSKALPGKIELGWMQLPPP